MKQIIQRGAEAVLFLDKDVLIKERVSKGYRHAEIDTKRRKLSTRTEARLLERASKLNVNVPKVFDVDEKNTTIKMEFVDGIRIKDSLEKKDWKKICFDIGVEVGNLHAGNVVHGDLTTSNMILKNGKIYFIDFGLGFWSDKVEDKAVDIHLFRQALESKHFRIYEKAWERFLEGYNSYKDANLVLSRLEKVEGRGRYKQKNKH